MKIGRNDPCPCGSGKKYKHCCLEKDEEAKRTARAEELTASTAPTIPTAAPTPPVPEESQLPDPRIQACNARWKAFEKEDDEGQIALFLKTLEEEELMDEEMAFEMLNVIYPRVIERNEHDRFDNLVEALRQRLPDIYAQNAAYYLDWRITNALVESRFEDARALAKEMVVTAAHDIDTFENVLDRLAYSGQASTLVEVSREAWPTVKDSSHIVPWGIDGFARQAADFELFEYLDHHVTPEPDDPELHKRMEFYIEIDLDRLRRYITYLIDRAGRDWNLDDFTQSRKRKKSRRRTDRQATDTEDYSPTNFEQNLFDLTGAFLGYLRREENVSYTRGELAREQIQSYILKRRAGDLEPRESMLEAMTRPQRRKPKPKSRRQPTHPLCPDRQTLDRHLANLMDFINPQYYKVAATLELVPAWLRFLTSCHLIDDQQSRQTEEDLEKLRDDLLALWKKTPSDPTLQRNLERAWPKRE